MHFFEVDVHCCVCAHARLGVNKLLGMEVHLSAAGRADYLLAHRRSPSSQRDILASIAQRLRHPDQLLEKLVDASDIGIFEQSAL